MVSQGSPHFRGLQEDVHSFGLHYSKLDKGKESAILQISWINPLLFLSAKRQLSFLGYTGHKQKLDYKNLQVIIMLYSKGIECDLGCRVREMNF